MPLNGADIELLHAAAGMDFFRPCTAHGTILLSNEEAQPLHSRELIETTGHENEYKITQKGIDRLNYEIGKR